MPENRSEQEKSEKWSEDGATSVQSVGGRGKPQIFADFRRKLQETADGVRQVRHL